MEICPPHLPTHPPNPPIATCGRQESWLWEQQSWRAGFELYQQKKKALHLAWTKQALVMWLWMSRTEGMRTGEVAPLLAACCVGDLARGQCPVGIDEEKLAG